MVCQYILARRIQPLPRRIQPARSLVVRLVGFEARADAYATTWPAQARPTVTVVGRCEEPEAPKRDT